MKRRFISSNNEIKLSDDLSNDELIPIPDYLEDYANYLRLLNDIPLTYLLTDPSDLSEESIRFGILDINWVDAYLDGAFSIGRISSIDGTLDKDLKKAYKAKENNANYLRIPRIQGMHPNHTVKQVVLQNQKANDVKKIDCSNISVVLIRSELVKSKKELHYLGYDKDSYDKMKRTQTKDPLPILRIEKIADDIMICLFSGIVDTFIIEEPLTGLKFGCNGSWYNGGTIDLRSTEDNSFGLCEDHLEINFEGSIDGNGRIHPQIIANKIKKNMTPSIFAFELFAIPHRAIFSTGN